MTEFEEILKDPENSNIMATSGLNGIMLSKDADSKFLLAFQLASMMKAIRVAKEKGKNVLKLLREFVEHGIKEGIENHPEKPACKAGCHHCCRQPCLVADDEIEELIPLVTEEMKPRLKKQAEYLRSKPSARDQYPYVLGKDVAECIFLKEGNCSIYEKRPLVCHLVLVKNVDACKIYENPGAQQQKISVLDSELAVSAWMNTTEFKTMQEGLAEKLGLIE